MNDPKIYDLQKELISDGGGQVYVGGFRDEYINDPSSLDYYLDFIDTESSLSQFNIDNIGRRTQVENNNEINCVFEPEIPDLVIIEAGQPDTAEKESRMRSPQPDLYSSRFFYL